MKEIYLKYNRSNDLYSENSRIRVNIGDEVRFIFPDGSDAHVRVVSGTTARGVTGGYSCDLCPFVAIGCPSTDPGGGWNLCPLNGFLIKIGSDMEGL